MPTAKAPKAQVKKSPYQGPDVGNTHKHCPNIPQKPNLQSQHLFRGFRGKAEEVATV